MVSKYVFKRWLKLLLTVIVPVVITWRGPKSRALRWAAVAALLAPLAFLPSGFLGSRGRAVLAFRGREVGIQIVSLAPGALPFFPRRGSGKHLRACLAARTASSGKEHACPAYKEAPLRRDVTVAPVGEGRFIFCGSFISVYMLSSRPLRLCPRGPDFLVHGLYGFIHLVAFFFLFPPRNLDFI